MTDHPAPNPNQPDALVDRITFALHDADCPDRKCEPHTMGKYRHQARAVLAAVLLEVERRAKADGWDAEREKAVRERIAQDILDLEHTSDEVRDRVREGYSVDWSSGFDSAVMDAARIAREGVTP